MSYRETVNITLSSVHRQISFDLPAKFYSRDEVEELIKDIFKIVDRDVFEVIYKKKESKL